MASPIVGGPTSQKRSAKASDHGEGGRVATTLDAAANLADVWHRANAFMKMLLQRSIWATRPASWSNAAPPALTKRQGSWPLPIDKFARSRQRLGSLCPITSFTMVSI